MDIVEEVRQILIAAKPANSNTIPCACSMRPASQQRIDELLAELDGCRPVNRTWERPSKTIVLHPAPYQRAMVGGRRIG